MNSKALFVIAFMLISFVSAAQVEVGDTIPDFTLKADNGENWNLSKDFTGKKLIVYFYPAAMTGGCTTQACAYRDASDDLKNEGAQVIGISGDEPGNLKIFKKAYDLNFPLLSDPDGKVAALFGVPTGNGGTITRNVDGRDVELKRDVTASRWTFILDKNDKIIHKATNVNPGEDSNNMLRILTQYH
ncbi:peroxiredoxin [Saccharicrinis sp. FJH54]|uniref:peroxiredoxin n=1 Tax=Saccharicrinis sp. FJH54 TaxID=3344665 RepID=UPI0035D425C2